MLWGLLFDTVNNNDIDNDTTRMTINNGKTNKNDKSFHANGNTMAVKLPATETGINWL